MMMNYMLANIFHVDLNWYNELSNEKMLVIMAGIFVNESTADTALNKLKLINTQALKFKSKLYTGCMH